jgi:hypothetical protein
MKRWGGRTARAVAGAALTIAACVIAVAGVVVATDGSTFPGGPAPTIALTPAAASVACDASGPYRVPDRGSVGVPDGVELCPGDARRIVVAGAVLDGWDVQGGIVVDAPDVVVRRSRIVGDGTLPYGITTTAAGSVRIEDVTLTGTFPEAAIGGDRWSGERIEITGVTGDGARLGEGARLRNSTVHDFAPSPGRAASALVLQGSGGSVVVEDNIVELGDGPDRDSAVLVAPDRTTARAGGPTVIRGNLLGGGRYTLRFGGEAASTTDVRITGNRFHRNAEQGPMSVSRRAVLEDNSYLDGGRLPAR